MKNLLTIIAIFIISLFSTAQNKNVIDETTITKRTITGSEGTKVLIKTEDKKEIQKVMLGEEKPNTLNIETKDSPVEVVSTTKITNPDGSVRTIDQDRSGIYDMNGKKMKLVPDSVGYIISSDSKKLGFLRKTSNNSYLFKTSSKTAIVYFDTSGNMIVDSYDDKQDLVKTDIYDITK